jgi:hypothetical protein
MIHTIPRIFAVVVTTLVATSGAAHAEKLSYVDSASDVHVFQADDTTTLVGDVVNTDVRSVRIDHRNRKLKAKFGYTDLTRTGVGFVSVLHVLSSEGRSLNVIVAAGRASWRGGAVLETAAGRDLECPSIRRTIDYDANTVKVSLGTDCLGEPRWVRVALEAASIQADDNLVYIDDAQHADVPTQGTTLSRKIRRG